jgi:hypothetical protein
MLSVESRERDEYRSAHVRSVERFYIAKELKLQQ